MIVSIFLPVFGFVLPMKSSSVVTSRGKCSTRYCLSTESMRLTFTSIPRESFQVLSRFYSLIMHAVFFFPCSSLYYMYYSDTGVDICNYSELPYCWRKGMVFLHAKRPEVSKWRKAKSGCWQWLLESHRCRQTCYQQRIGYCGLQKGSSIL